MICWQAYGSVGRYDEAERLFESLQDPDAVAVSTMLAMQDTVGTGGEASLLSQMRDHSITSVDSRVLNQLLIRRAEGGRSHVAIVSQGCDRGVKSVLSGMN